MSRRRDVEDPLLRRAIPADDASSDFFWTSGQDGLLRILRCANCEYFIHPPSTPCPRCLSAAVEPEPTSGLGTVHTFTVNVQPWVAAQKPYVIAVVQLVEQPELRLTTNLVECPVDKVRIGQGVRVAFVHRHELWYPVFRIDDAP
jgi:uncharacterized protein